MANGKKTGGRDFEPGKSGNPAGRPPLLPAELRAKLKNYKTEWREMTLELLKLPFARLKEIVKDPNTESDRAAVASLILHAGSRGDHKRIGFILDWLVGPLKNQVELSGPDGEPLAPVVAMSSQELTVTLLAIQKQIKKETVCKSLPNSPPSLEPPPRSSRRGSRGAS